jgi:hypothetical protein
MSGFDSLLSPMTHMTARFPEIKNPAEWMYERLVRSIAQFEEKLEESQEIGLRLVNFGNHETFHILDVGFWGPDLVKFYGSSFDGKPFELMQHMSQVNVLLVAVPKTSEKPRRIGFELVKQLKSD